MNRDFIGALCLSAVAALLAGCGGSPPAIGAPVRPSNASSTLHGTPAPRAKRTHGIYVSELFGTSILGYRPNDRGNDPPKC